MNQMYIVLMLAFVELVLTVQTAHGVGEMVLNNGSESIDNATGNLTGAYADYKRNVATASIESKANSTGNLTTAFANQNNTNSVDLNGSEPVAPQFICFGEWRCVSGWKHAIIQAQTDWNSGQYTKITNGGNPDCPIKHTPEYCNGYAKGYTYEWNILYQQTQTAKAQTYCSQTYLTQQERYNCGYNRGYLDAQTDWNLNHVEDNSCPRATEHTPEYCNGYAKGYTYEWNTLSTTQLQPPSTPTQPENKTTPTQPENKTTPTGPSLATLYNKGIDLYHLGNYTGSIGYFDKVLHIDPKYIAALYGKGTDLFKLGNYSGAILYYDKTLDIDAKDVHALTDKGVSLYKLGNYTGAIEYFDKALTVNPKHKNALYNKGLVLDEVGNNTGALTYLDRFLAIDPKDEDALYEKGAFLDKLGNHTGAIEYFDKALIVDPHQIRTHKWS